MLADRITVYLNNNCNLSCKYCFQNKDFHNNKGKVSLDIINQLSEYCHINNIKRIHFFGGEPLIYKDLLFYSVNKIREINPKIIFHLTTNGTLIDNNVIELFKQYDFRVRLSLDGKKETHNKYREDYKKIERWFDKLKELNHIDITMVCVDPKYLYENISHIWKIGFKKVYVNILRNEGWYNINDLEHFEKQYELAIRDVINGKGLLMCAERMFYQLSETKYIKRCGIVENGLAMNLNGDLYPCHHAVEYPDLYIGTVKIGIDSEKERGIRKRMWKEINKFAHPSPYFCIKCPLDSYHDDISCKMYNIQVKLVSKYYKELFEVLHGIDNIDIR